MTDVYLNDACNHELQVGLDDDAMEHVYEQGFKDQRYYKLTITYDRKFWKRSRAWSRSWEVLSGVLYDADVESALCVFETHKDGFPHIHGIVKWSHEMFESKEYLMKKLNVRFGRTTCFLYDNKDYLEHQVKSGKKIEYESYYDYMKKQMTDVREMVQGAPIECFPNMYYRKVEREEEEYEEIEPNCITKFFMK